MTAVVAMVPARKPSSTRMSSSGIDGGDGAEDDDADAPGDRGGLVAVQRDQGLGDGQGDDEHAVAGHEQPEVDAS